uniref:Serine/threonine-protein kinase SBK2 n=1 Tax=Chelydra serpentina TaxID=8475 RepID=A0A8C3SV27_CHESE
PLDGCSSPLPPVVSLQDSVMAQCPGAAALAMLDEMLEITAQSLVHTEVAEHYQVIRELGRGKYGHVVLVTHRQRGTPMALKLLPKAHTKLHTFLYEYCVALSLATHPAIIGMFGIAIESSQHYGFLYEPALHRDLISIIKPRVSDGIPEPAAKQCAKQLVSALEFIHSRGLVYRDVKPENVLLFDPECRCIKLTDFGLTRPKGTRLKLVAGVIPYTAPELSNTTGAQGLSIDASLDAWAFGVMLFCLLTGYFPWEQSLPADPFFEDFMLWQESGLDEDLPCHWRRLTAEATRMLRSLLALDPAQRSPVSGALHYVDCPWRVENWRGLSQALIQQWELIPTPQPQLPHPLPDKGRSRCFGEHIPRSSFCAPQPSHYYKNRDFFINKFPSVALFHL